MFGLVVLWCGVYYTNDARTNEQQIQNIFRVIEYFMRP